MKFLHFRFPGKQSKDKGYTLAELLIVLSVIGLLMTTSAIMLNDSLKRSRDSRRKADLEMMATALELYYKDNGGYPYDSSTSGEQWKHICGLSTAIFNILVDQKYLSELPCDPINNNEYRYRGDLNGSTGTSCAIIPTQRCATYCIWTELETEEGKYSVEGGDYPPVCPPL
jgi:prepilin-type N-terminal cleavage/methylation domain-containing protein